jgi:hypothetical protein
MSYNNPVLKQQNAKNEPNHISRTLEEFAGIFSSNKYLVGHNQNVIKTSDDSPPCSEGGGRVENDYSPIKMKKLRGEYGEQANNHNISCATTLSSNMINSTQKSSLLRDALFVAPLNTNQ